MNLATKRRIAADVLKVGKDRVYFDPERLADIKEAITKADIRKLIQEYAIQAKPVVGNSKSRIRKNKEQKKKGRRQGPGSRKGKKRSRLSKKDAWMAKIRAQRNFLKTVKENKLLDTKTYRDVYRKSKGGFFRSVRHIKIYLTERNLFKKK
ncbi:MAG: 50S ribosomal protein L19e [Nanoarchaeota archaeon]|nr:50S ribosomal protein L19e [Nanoarchaeota archaeon]MBU4352460.1 50S ribosomal protein L19e [Nanoarchaeota archaeon]